MGTLAGHIFPGSLIIIQTLLWWIAYICDEIADYKKNQSSWTLQHSQFEPDPGSGIEPDNRVQSAPAQRQHQTHAERQVEHSGIVPISVIYCHLGRSYYGSKCMLIEVWFRMITPLIGIYAELQVDHFAPIFDSVAERPWIRVAYIHSVLYIIYFFSGVCIILIRRQWLPVYLGSVSLASTVSVQGIVFYYHATMQKQIESLCHVLLASTCLLVAFAIHRLGKTIVELDDYDRFVRANGNDSLSTTVASSTYSTRMARHGSSAAGPGSDAKVYDDDDHGVFGDEDGNDLQESVAQLPFSQAMPAAATSRSTATTTVAVELGSAVSEHLAMPRLNPALEPMPRDVHGYNARVRLSAPARFFFLLFNMTLGVFYIFTALIVYRWHWPDDQPPWGALVMVIFTLIITAVAIFLAISLIAIRCFRSCSPGCSSRVAYRRIQMASI
jgi:hypothetical protein